LIRSENIRTLLIGLGLVLVQIVLFRNLRIFEAEADLVLIFVIWMCTKRNKTESLLFAALFGFFQDSLTDLWGLNMFSKTLIVFILHSYLNRISETRFIFWQIFLIILVIAFLHNAFFLGVSLFSDVYASDFIVWSLLFVSSLFTAILGSFLHLVRNES
jgi:rod shape-determining protein MreD